MVQNAWIECVPNFAEGRDPATIDAIAHAVRMVDGAYLLGAERDHDHHRSVITLIARPEAVVPAAVAMVGAAIERIDLTAHAGEHPRMGACDVFPLVPLIGVTIEECNAIAVQVASALAEAYALPIYLYEESARLPQRRQLEQVRTGGTLEDGQTRAGAFEWLRWKMPQLASRHPDFGPREVHPTAGVTAVGTRFFLLAYNVNLETTDRKLAVRIANRIREARGGLPAVKALGLSLAERDCVQVSMNLVDYRRSGFFDAFTAVAELAAEEGVTIRESELIGLVPQDALDRAFRRFCRLGEWPRSRIIPGKTQLAVRWPVSWAAGHSGPTAVELRVECNDQLSARVQREFEKIERMGGTIGTGELVEAVGEATIREAVRQFLKMVDLPPERVLEEAANRATAGRFAGTVLPEEPVAMLRPFLRELASHRPTPGGGGVAALAAALAAACGSMVSNFTVGRKKFAAHAATVNAILARLTAARERAVRMIHEDAAAFEAVSLAWKLPTTTPARAERKQAAMQAAMVQAAEVPLACAELAVAILRDLQTLAPIGNPTVITDVGAGALSAQTAVETALLNVRINIRSLADRELAAQLARRCGALSAEARQLCDSVMAVVDAALADEG